MKVVAGGPAGQAALSLEPLMKLGAGDVHPLFIQFGNRR